MKIMGDYSLDYVVSEERLHAVVFVLYHQGEVLLEKRKAEKIEDAGMIDIPGGYIEIGENVKIALEREVNEELSVLAKNYFYLTCIDYPKTDGRIVKLHYVCVTQWDGEIDALEAEEVFWQKIFQKDNLYLNQDRLALSLLETKLDEIKE